MNPFRCELDGASIVLIGSFNPTIFQPAWFEAQRLLRPEEVQAAKIGIIHPQITSFEADWLHLEVQNERLSASTVNEGCFLALRDLVLGIFTVLDQTPFTQMGINRHMHYRVDSRETWHAFGHALAPKEAWNPLLESPGLATLVVNGTRKGSTAKRISVTVQASVRVDPGIYVLTNEHFERSGAGSTRELLDVLQTSWDDAQAYAKHAAEHLLTTTIGKHP